ncbi:DUF724 domain-containing protein 7-like isoform X2 [Amaranthus tricolor]|uniref:DUF724 domain-containing protein 7-like isoform X2 n=1 Tax=Amaranthus tricolor TaxID=29722 RepID=UPI00258557F8|nr:DUF724 domain-containing protein 7-like isoform X2 [Amaranthus tricolor]
MASSLSKLQLAYKETFKKGTKLEVSFDEEGLRGSWYTATVTRPLSRRTHQIEVEYHNLFQHEFSSKALCESVAAILVRPIPPLDPHGEFSLMDDVDVFHNDGWWEGVVTNVSVLESSSIHLYSVYFRSSREQIDCPPYEIRLHREWLSGNLWVPPLERHCASSSYGMNLRSSLPQERGEDHQSHEVHRQESEQPKEGKTMVLKRKRGRPRKVPDDSNIRAVQVFDDSFDDDSPASAGIEGAHSLPTNDSRRCSAGPSGHYNESVENIQTAIVPLQSDLTAIVPVEEQDLPFVKSSAIWQYIENMEILKRIPQKPHFRSLYNKKEECREGLAIGYTINFANLVERITKACFDEPKSVLDGYLEALVEFEDQGFDVAPVREKLNTMISIKSRLEQAQNASKEFESQFMERNLEMSTINRELAEVDKKKGELLEKESVLLLERKKKEAEIISLQTSMNSIKRTSEATQEEFEKVATSLFN